MLFSYSECCMQRPKSNHGISEEIGERGYIALALQYVVWVLCVPEIKESTPGHPSLTIVLHIKGFLDFLKNW